MNPTFKIYIAAMVFIIFDILTGIIKSIYNKTFTSTNMRKGGLRKLVEFILLIIIAFVQIYIKDSVPNFPIDTLYAIPGYVVLMEFSSIMENISEVNPDLKKLFPK